MPAKDRERLVISIFLALLLHAGVFFLLTTLGSELETEDRIGAIYLEIETDLYPEPSMDLTNLEAEEREPLPPVEPEPENEPEHEETIEPEEILSEPEESGFNLVEEASPEEAFSEPEPVVEVVESPSPSVSISPDPAPAENTSVATAVPDETASSYRADLYGPELEESRDAPLFIRPERRGLEDNSLTTDAESSSAGTGSIALVTPEEGESISADAAIVETRADLSESSSSSSQLSVPVSREPLTDTSLNQGFTSGNSEVVMTSEEEEVVSIDPEILLQRSEDTLDLVELLEETREESSRQSSSNVSDSSEGGEGEAANSSGTSGNYAFAWEGASGDRSIISHPLPENLSGVGASVTVTFELTVTAAGYVKGTPRIIESSGSSEADSRLQNSLRSWQFSASPGSPDVSGIIRILLQTR